MDLCASRKQCRTCAAQYFSPMKFLRDHWYDLGGGFAMPVAVALVLRHDSMTQYQLLMWLSLVSLFLHQLEEYRVIGTFPGMVNSVLFNSSQPDRYPLNPKTALVVNVGIGWMTYLLAAVLAERAVWLGMATILVSAGNVIAHTFLFNIRGRSFFNAGMITAILLFLPIVIWFFELIHRERLANWTDYASGIATGLILNYVGILKLIGWMADRDSPYRFSPRQMLRK